MEHSDPQEGSLLERAWEPENMKLAWKQVKRNGGAAGVDGRSIAETEGFLRDHWPEIRCQLLEGRYRPRPVKRVEIPKPGGGVRKLGIPTVLDRLIQQSIAQILIPLFDPEFSESSFGFRPGRSAHDALRHAQKHQEAGKQWVVDLDLKQFFDEVDHDLLLGRVGRKVKDKRLKRLINAFLKAGVEVDGSVEPTEKGTPQGGPLSPLLSNILLDDLDRELERRGLSFSRYADDCNIYVGSRKAGERVMASVTRFVERKLKLKVNREKSAVDRPWKRSFLGLTFRKIWGRIRICIPESAWIAFRENVRKLFRPGRGMNVERFINEVLNPVVRGWVMYFRIGASKKALATHDFWIRRRLRCLIWRQWRSPKTRCRKLKEHGCEGDAVGLGCTRRGPWWASGTPPVFQALPPEHFRKLGLFNLGSVMLSCDS